MFKLRRPGKKEAKPNREFWRSNSLPLSRRFSLDNGDDPSVTFLDDTNIQIIISSSNHIPSLSHEQTPVATSPAASPQDENRGLNEMTPQDLNVATKLSEEYPADLAIARDDEEQLTALHMLVRKPSEELYQIFIFFFFFTLNIFVSILHMTNQLCLLLDMKEDNNKEAASGVGLQLLKKLWSQVRQLEYKKILELITQPSAVLFDAVKSGNVEAVKWLLYMNRELLTIKNNNGRNLLHYTVLYRQSSIFFFILKMGAANLILRAVDNDRNNVLHLAAHLQDEASSSLRPNIQMQRELVWFKEVEKRVPPELRTMRNNKGKTPKDIFYDNHKKLSKEVKDAAKGIAESGMLVATLIATVAFAAALTVPGDKTNAWFIVFVLTNAIALFTSSASIISFLSIFTSSRFTESEFIISLHPSLILGLTLLFISIATMVIAFAAASFLTFEHTSKWVAYVVASMGVFPILLFLVLQFSLFDGLLDYFFWSRYYRLSKLQ
ncbi:Ankyrin repeat-containing protein [Spatholobus suberectus]|nr:Ankyrin repeat-containing protein [Spatholobus suberectus]